MKRDLERFKDKMTPEEERHVWSKMRDGLGKGEPGRASWFPRLWLGRVVAAGAAAAVAVVIWQTGLLTPDHVTENRMAAQESPIIADEMRETVDSDATDVTQEKGLADSPEANATDDVASTPGDVPEKSSVDKGAEPVEPERIAPEMVIGDVGAAGVAAEHETMDEPEKPAAGAEGRLEEKDKGGEEQQRTNAVDDGVMRPVPPDTRVYEETLETAATVDLNKSREKATMPKVQTFEGEEGEPYQAKKGVAARMQSFFGAAGNEKSEVRDAGDIRGRVTDQAGAPLAGAMVTIEGTRYGAITDDNGLFGIRNVPAGTYTLVISAAGCADLKLPGIVVEKGRTYDTKVLTLGVEGKDEDASENEVYEERVGNASPSVTKSMAAHDPADMMLEGPPVSRSELKRRDKKGGGYPSLTGGQRPVNDQLADDMFFQSYGTNPFIDAEEDALSTFGLDVDTGSYTICRRYINEGQLPPPDAVRVEEFVNFFPKDFDPPDSGDFSIHTDGMPSPFAHVRDGNYYLLRIGIRGRVVDDRHRKPAQIVLVIDTSGSMGMGNRLPLLKSAMEVLLDELRPDDEIGIVEFGSQAREVMPLTRVSEGDDILRAIRSLRDGGSTNAEHGLKLGYKMLRRGAREGRLHRIIFCSDGVANVGNTGWESILENVRKESDEISLTTIGFGMGNYNDVLMEQLADAGDGQYAYVDNMREAKRVLRQNLTGTLQTIAKDAKAQIEFYPDYVIKYRLLGYENRDIRDEDFRDDTIDAGEIGAGHEVTVLYEVKLQEKLHKGAMATVHLRYEDPETGRVREIDEPVSPRFVSRDLPYPPADLVMDACVAEFAEILKHSYWAKDSELEDVLDLLRDADERMTSRADVDELIGLVKKAIRIEKDDERGRRWRTERYDREDE